MTSSPSELMNKAIRAYGDDDFLCHTLEKVAGKQDQAVVEFLKRRIQRILDKAETITLMNYLKYTDPTYAALWGTYEAGHSSEQCHNYRIQWWRAFTNKLVNEGL